jgi:hypothetical protein
MMKVHFGREGDQVARHVLLCREALIHDTSAIQEDEQARQPIWHPAMGLQRR